MSNNNNNTMEQQQAGLDQLVQGLNDTDLTRSSAGLKRPNPSLAKLGYNETLAKLGYGDAGPSLQNVHSIFAAGLERRRRAAIGDIKTCDTSDSEPQAKKRRYQRRNSKTSAMLFKSMNFLPQDLFDDKDKTTTTTTEAQTSSKSSESQGIPRAPQDDDADWDGGLEIAEQLVKHLQKRRTSDVSAH